MSKLILIDGNSILNRAFYALPPLANSEGVYTNAITGFLNSLLRVIEKINATHVAVAFDLRFPTFRHKLYDGYKKRRKGMPNELAAQLPLLKEILDIMGIKRLELEGYEADDLIGTASSLFVNSATSHEDTVFIATGDRDSFQLINERCFVVLASGKSPLGDLIYTPETIREKYSLSPKQLIDTKALMGDSSDDIPGVKGIGEKTALSLIQKYESVDYIYENLDNLEIRGGVKTKLLAGYDICIKSRILGTIVLDAPIEFNLCNFEIIENKQNWKNNNKLLEFLTKLELLSILKKLKGIDIKHKSALVSNSPDIGKISIDEIIDKIYTLEKLCFGEKAWTRPAIESSIKSQFALYIIEENAYIIGSRFLGECNILTIGVLPECRSKGVGSLILKQFLSLCQEDDVFLEVRSKNIPAIRLYERFGFKRIGLRKNYYGDDDGITMKLERH